MDFSMMSLAKINSLINSGDATLQEVASSFDGKRDGLFFTLNEMSFDGADIAEIDSDKINVPFVVSDDICTLGIRTTAGSMMLKDFVPPYNAAVCDKLDLRFLVGKTAVSEFCSGESSEKVLGEVANAVKNPLDSSRVGIAAVNAVVGGCAGFALATDGGSVRNVAAEAGIVAMKPTYGAVSRHGVVSFGSSVSSVIPITKSVKDNAFVFASVAGYDSRDAVSATEMKDFDKDEFYSQFRREFDAKKVVVGFPKKFVDKFICEEQREQFLELISTLKSFGVDVCEVEIPKAEFGLQSFYILESAEGASNLARYDGVHFGFRSKNYSDLDSLYKNTRSEGFGEEIKRRILVGNHFLIGENFEQIYRKALKVRAGLKKEMLSVFEDCDFIVMPTLARETGGFYFEKDRFLALASLVGLPSLAMPFGLLEGGSFAGVQFVGKAFSECEIYQLGSVVEKKLNLAGKGGRA